MSTARTSCETGAGRTADAAGAEIIMELTDQPYGSREYAAIDPEGNAWSFGTYRPGVA